MIDCTERHLAALDDGIAGEGRESMIKEAQAS